MPALAFALPLPRATVVTQTITNLPGPTGTTSSHPPPSGEYLPIGAIVGGTLAGIILTLCVAIGWKYWGYRLAKPITKKPAHLRIPGEKFSKLPSRPSSAYSRMSSVKTGSTTTESKTKITEPLPALVIPTTPTKNQKCLLRTTPMPAAGRFSPTSKLVTMQEETSPTKRHHRHSQRSRRSGSTSPTVQAPDMVELGKDSVRFPLTGAPQQVQVKYASAAMPSETYGGQVAGQQLLNGESTGVRLSRVSSANSNDESVGQVHHLSYMSHPPPRVY